MLKKLLILLSIFAIGTSSGVKRNHHYNCHKHIHRHKTVTKTIIDYRHTVTKTVNLPCKTDVDIGFGTGIMEDLTTTEPQETMTTTEPQETTTDIDETTTTIEPDETTIEIDETTTEIDEPQETSVEQGGSDSIANCLKIFNKFRASQNLPPFKSATASEIECANKAAAYDARMGYHSSFYNRMCSYAKSQCECMPGVNGGGLENCINAYISEGPPGTIGQFPGENHGHWNIIVGDFTHVACGTDGNGFYTHNFY